jgi:hypothetical protein
MLFSQENSKVLGGDFRSSSLSLPGLEIVESVGSERASIEPAEDPFINGGLADESDSSHLLLDASGGSNAVGHEFDHLIDGVGEDHDMGELDADRLLDGPFGEANDEQMDASTSQNDEPTPSAPPPQPTAATSASEQEMDTEEQSIPLDSSSPPATEPVTQEAR